MSRMSGHRIEAAMTRIRLFVSVYRMYRKAHTPRYSAGIAWSMAFTGLPF